MTVPSVAQGRGAWTKSGKDNDSRFYTAIVGKPWDGSFPVRDVNYQAVYFGVKAIQSRINDFCLIYGRNPVSVDGNYSPIDREVVKFVQAKLGFTGASVDGVVGPSTSKALFRDLLIWSAGVHHVPASQLHGFIMLESLYDPGAVGSTTPSDRGLNQINLNAHPNITVEQAFDPKFSIDYTAKRLGDARIKYSGKGADLKNRCAIAQHNAPLAADLWYRDEAPPVGPTPYNGRIVEFPNIEKYVDLVLGHALAFK